MDNSQYRSNIFKTLSQKPARAGLKYVAGNQQRTNIAHLITGIATEVGELFEGLQPYILGEQFTDSLKENAAEELGDVGYYIVGLAKVLKVKLPSSTKKIKLDKGTRTKNLLQLLKYSSDMLDLQKKYFYGVQTTAEEYEAGTRVVLGVEKEYPAGVKYVFDKEAQAEYDKEFTDKVVALLQPTIDLYWRLCYDLTGQPPAPIFAGNIAKLAVRYPEGTFDMRSQEERKKDKEMAAMNKANTETTAVQPVAAAPIAQAA